MVGHFTTSNNVTLKFESVDCVFPKNTLGENQCVPA